MNGASLLVACLGISVGTGCARGHKTTPEAQPEPGRTSEAAPGATAAVPQAVAPRDQASGWATTPLPLGAGPVVVKEGPAPLVYMVESSGAFRVHDQTDNKDLARAEALGRTIIRIDARSGVAMGRETLLAGPLPADHRYAIYLDPSGPNYSRQGTFQPRPQNSGE